MTRFDSLAQRLIGMGPPDYGYHLERVPIDRDYTADHAPLSVDASLTWTRDWHDEAGRYTWQAATDAERRRAVRFWLFLRWRHAADWRQRGGVDA